MVEFFVWRVSWVPTVSRLITAVCRRPRPCSDSSNHGSVYVRFPGMTMITCPIPGDDNDLNDDREVSNLARSSSSSPAVFPTAASLPSAPPPPPPPPPHNVTHTRQLSDGEVDCAMLKLRPQN